MARFLFNMQYKYLCSSNVYLSPENKFPSLIDKCKGFYYSKAGSLNSVLRTLTLSFWCIRFCVY